MPSVAYFNNEFVPFDQAKVSVMNHAFNYGTAVFEGVRAYWNAAHGQLYVFRLAEHCQRLASSGKLLRMDLGHTSEEIAGLVVELLRRENMRNDMYIRPLGYKSDDVIGVRLHNLTDRLTIFATPLSPTIDRAEGANVCVSPWRRNDDNALPPRGKIAGGYVNPAFIKTDAQLKGFDDAIVLNQDGHVAEGSAQNLFMVRGGQLVTCPATANVLEGITRDTLLTLAPDFGIPVRERQIDRTELYLADELFFCGTGVEVVPITSVDHYAVGDGRIGPVSARIGAIYRRVVHGDEPAYLGWCTPVFDR
jgi:branched-chain amino acid aminotransferase